MRKNLRAELSAFVELVAGRPAAASRHEEEAEARKAEAEDAGPPESWPAWTEDRAAMGPTRRHAGRARRS